MPRKYVPFPEKHKWPKGFGSLCPKKMPDEVPQALLDAAIPVPGMSANKLWSALGNWCFCAHPSPQVGPDVWHGFPVVGSEVDERVLEGLEQAGMISTRERRHLRKQRELPTTWE